MNRQAFTQGVGRVLDPVEMITLAVMWGGVLGFGMAVSQWGSGLYSAGMGAVSALLSLAVSAGSFFLAHKHIPTPSRPRQLAVGVVLMLVLSPLGSAGRILMTVLLVGWLVLQARLNRTGESIL